MLEQLVNNWLMATSEGRCGGQAAEAGSLPGQPSPDLQPKGL
jgi:hypothetical protein